MLVRIERTEQQALYIHRIHARSTKKTRGQMIVGSVFEVQGIATVSRYLLQWVGRSRRMRQEQTPTANMALFEVTRRRTRKPG